MSIGRVLRTIRLDALVFVQYKRIVASHSQYSRARGRGQLPSAISTFIYAYQELWTHCDISETKLGFDRRDQDSCAFRESRLHGRTLATQSVRMQELLVLTLLQQFLALSAVAIVTVLVLWKPTALRRMWHALTNNSDGDVAGVLQAGGRRDTRRSSSGRSPNRSSVLPQQQHRYVRVSNGRRL